jgi:predicted Ser/Thr protein kinase
MNSIIKKDYRIISKFGGKHAKSVKLLKHHNTEELIVRKTYSSSKKDFYHNEVNILKKLNGLHFVPKLLGYNDNKLSFYMSYCGPTITNIYQYQSKIHKYSKILKKQYGIYHNDIKTELYVY